MTAVEADAELERWHASPKTLFLCSVVITTCCDRRFGVAYVVGIEVLRLHLHRGGHGVECVAGGDGRDRQQVSRAMRTRSTP